MKYRPIGRQPIEASAIAMGTWAIGGWKWGGSGDKAAEDAERIDRIIKSRGFPFPREA